MTFHDLRHTNASLMLASGVSSKVAGNRLGHSKVSITLDLYSHVLESVDRETAEKIDMLIKNNTNTMKVLKR
nr:tyrosine-type recombinase/integrase [Clostridium kluyveri]